MFPCNECAKLMIQAGISEVVYHEGKDVRHDTPNKDGFRRVLGVVGREGGGGCRGTGACLHGS
jgi:deoxycytidylate deaminase